ncbi:hypothetical protein [Paenibacillus sp. V4I5]|uniref:hypothetical protein n=1 Tax=Paenibacillus sp. V4I5 TaxID=3042306 RepID=UPI0027931060|nr:hypothetical protein [Paenibacillus sp. V4I5]MDQ0916011.1 hypothetical protein [Paenibacillus sp. V4I5]
MEKKVIWSIGSTESGAEDLFDNYKDPNRLGDIVWDADAKCSSTLGTKWPMFHPSEADPDGGYRLQVTMLKSDQILKLGDIHWISC